MEAVAAARKARKLAIAHEGVEATVGKGGVGVPSALGQSEQTRKEIAFHL